MLRSLWIRKEKVDLIHRPSFSVDVVLTLGLKSATLLRGKDNPFPTLDGWVLFSVIVFVWSPETMKMWDVSTVVGFLLPPSELELQIRVFL